MGARAAGIVLCLQFCAERYREAVRVRLLAAKINAGAELGASGARQVPGKHRLPQRHWQPKGFEGAAGEHSVALRIVKVISAPSPPIK